VVGQGIKKASPGVDIMNEIKLKMRRKPRTQKTMDGWNE